MYELILEILRNSNTPVSVSYIKFKLLTKLKYISSKNLKNKLQDLSSINRIEILYSYDNINKRFETNYKIK